MSASPWIQTYTGKAYDLLTPTVEQVCIEDIAHALSNLCRFTGHAREFYSVAQHCTYVARIVEDLWRHDHGGDACPAPVLLAALMHDASEAYVGDSATPLKVAMRAVDPHAGEASPYDVIEARAHAVIVRRFGLDTSHAQIIKRADVDALCAERLQLLGPSPRPGWPAGLAPVHGFRPWPAERARFEFCWMFRAYGGGQ